MIKLPNEDGFKLDDYPLYNLNRTSATYTNEMAEAMQTIGLNQTQWRILAILGDKNNSTVSEVARKGVIKISTLTRMLERMEKDALLKRTPWKEDKRIVRVSLTAKGRKALSGALNISASVFHLATKDISEQDMQVFLQVLKKVRSNLTKNPHNGS